MVFWDFSHLRLPLVFCCSRFSEAVFEGKISRQFCSVFCCSRLSGLCFAVRGFRKRCSKARFREAQTIVCVDLKGNVKAFFDSGFGRFRLVSRWCLGLFASRAPRPERVLVFEAFGLLFFCSKLISRQFCSVFCCSRLSGSCFAVRGLSEAVFQGQISRGTKRLFLWIPKVT